MQSLKDPDSTVSKKMKNLPPKHNLQLDFFDATVILTMSRSSKVRGEQKNIVNNVKTERYC